MALKLVRDEFTLLYGMQIFRGKTSDSPSHARVAFTAPNGEPDEMTLHTIAGTREKIREQLLQSIDAFFELVEPTG